jgi:hypothetical protein
MWAFVTSDMSLHHFALFAHLDPLLVLITIVMSSGLQPRAAYPPLHVDVS